MEIYICVQTTKRTEWGKRHIRVRLARACRTVEKLLGAIAFSAAWAALIIACMADGMDAGRFILYFSGSAAAAGMALIARSAVRRKRLQFSRRVYNR